MTRADTSAPLLQIDALTVSIGGTQILKHASLDVAAGEIVGLVGASGSGKSMTALAIMQLLPANARLGGAIRLRGETLTGKSESELRKIRGRDIGIVFQEPMTALNPLMRIGDQVAETVRLHRSVSRTEASRMARATLDLAGLAGESGAADRLPFELSGGQGSGWRSPWQWSWSPPCSLPTSPPALWMPVRKCRCCSCCRSLRVPATWA